MSRLIGEWSDQRPSDEEVREVCQKVQAEVESQLNRMCQEFSPCAYRVHLTMGGSKYVIKIKIAQEQYIHTYVNDTFLSGGIISTVANIKSLLTTTSVETRNMTTPLGEWTELKPATQEIADICSQVKSELEEKTNKTFPEFFAYAYQVNQRIGGATYVVKVYVGQGKSIFLTIGNMLTQSGNSYSLTKYEDKKNPYDTSEV